MHSSQLRLHAIGLAIASAWLGLVANARADELGDLKTQVDDLQRKIAELEKRPASAATRDANASGAVLAGATKGSFRLPDSDTSITLGGYVKLDAIYSDKSAGVNSTADQQYEAGSVPVGPNAGANERNQIKLHARQSRLFFKTDTPTPVGGLGTFLEFDLFGTSGNESVSNSHGLRVRHAYGTLGNFLAGQTWTTFSDPSAYPETLDFGGPAGQIFVRQAQVRWTQPFAGGQWAVALENPESVVALPDGTSFRADDDRFPDIAANLQWPTAFGKYSLAGLIRQVRVDSASAPASQTEKWGYGIGVNGVIPFGSLDDARFSLYQGNALGRYTVGFFSDGILDTEGQVSLPSQWVAAASYRHYWSATVRSTLALSALHANNGAGTAGGVNKEAQSAHLNVIWSPVKQANLGLEYLLARRETTDGSSGRLNRVQASAQYFF
ncbi:MAG TPA: DcaP family trimeric outer membrane transporter [Burkholderiaceae bacterium]|nr:DcaP family trimeric outer membrane transporter [Burkholderiaceae bacterium]